MHETVDLKVSYHLSDDGQDATLVLPEKFVFGVNAAINKAMKELPDANKRVMLDFSTTKIIDSAGMGILLALQEDLNKEERQLSLIGVGGDVARLLQKVHLDKALTIAFVGDT
mgnify:CR=1 FL=1